MELNSFQKNTDIWERIYKENIAGSMKYPCEDFVVMLNRYFAGITTKGKKLLCVGFGSGNNLIVAAEKLFDCYGVEVSASAIQIARQRLKVKGIGAQLYLILKNKYPFDNNFFDVVVAWNVLYYNDKCGLKNVLKEIKRIMKAGGFFFAIFRLLKSFAYQRNIM